MARDQQYKDGKKHIYNSLIAINGLLIQQIVWIEELGELQKEIIKCIRGDQDIEHLAEEMADAEIVIEQLKQYYNLDDKVESYKDEKIKRLLINYPIKMKG